MPRLTDAALLTLFEQGQGATPLRRARLLGTVLIGEQEVTTRPISDLDRAAWALRQTLIGGPAEAVCSCPACAAKLEFELPAGFALPDRSSDHAQVTLGEQVVDIRLPALGDLDASGLAFENLAKDAPWQDTTFRDRAEAALEQADPMLNFQLAMTCAECGAAHDYRFDILAYVWAELEDRARHVIKQVTALARHFGWSEGDILGMSARRRSIYMAEIAT